MSTTSRREVYESRGTRAQGGRCGGEQVEETNEEFEEMTEYGGARSRLELRDCGSGK